MEQNNSENKYRTLASDTIIFIIGTVLAKAIQFLLMPLYTTYLSTDAYGVAELTNNLSDLLFPIATLCIYEAAFRFAVGSEFDNKRLATAVIKVMARSIVVGSIVASVAHFKFHYKYSIYLFFILYSYSIKMCAAYYVRGKGLSKVFAISGVINAIVLSFFSVIFLVIFKSSEVGYLISIGLSYCCSAVYLLIKGDIFRSYQRKIDSNGDLSILFEYCVPLIFYNVLYWFTTISGRYILLWFTDASTVGKYVAAIKIAAVINMIQQAVYAAFQLNTSKAYNEASKEAYYTEITNLFISIYCTFGSIIVCATPILANLTLKNDFYDARIYLPIIMLSAIINCISSVVGAMYSTYKKTHRVVMVSLIGAVINVVVGITLTPSLEIWGICIASFLCYFIQTIYKFIDIKKFCNIEYKWKTVIPSILLLILQVTVMSLNISHRIVISILLSILLIIINSKGLLRLTKQLLKR